MFWTCCYCLEIAIFICASVILQNCSIRKIQICSWETVKTILGQAGMVQVLWGRLRVVPGKAPRQSLHVHHQGKTRPFGTFRWCRQPERSILPPRVAPLALDSWRKTYLYYWKFVYFLTECADIMIYIYFVGHSCLRYCLGPFLNVAQCTVQGVTKFVGSCDKMTKDQKITKICWNKLKQRLKNINIFDAFYFHKYLCHTNFCQLSPKWYHDTWFISY